MNEQYLNQLKQNSVMTASKGELTLMLYNGCLKFIKQAETAIDEGDLQSKNELIIKAQKIITEMMITMDRKYEITNEILPMFEYIRFKLIEANTKNDKESLLEAYKRVKELKDTWVEVLKMQKQGALK